MLMTMKVCWIVTQQGAVPTVTVNSTAPFTGTANPSIPTSGVGTRVILEAFMPIFFMASADRLFIGLSSCTRIL